MVDDLIDLVFVIIFGYLDVIIVFFWVLVVKVIYFVVDFNSNFSKINFIVI